MKTFRGLVCKGYNNSFLERIGDSIWWTNHLFILKDDPRMFKYVEERGYSKKDLLDNLDEGETRNLVFEKGSRGYRGLKSLESSKNNVLSNFLRNFGGRKENIFLSKFPLKNYSFEWDKGTRLIVDKEINDYIVKNLSPTKLCKGDDYFFKYFRGNEFVALYVGKQYR